jgi:hypothetical protein
VGKACASERILAVGLMAIIVFTIKLKMDNIL